MGVLKPVSDTDIVQNILSGHGMDGAVRSLYRDHFQGLAWFIMNNGGTKADAEDIFQEVVVGFIDLIKKQRFRGESSIKTFLFSMNRHLWLNELKRKGRALQRELKYEMNSDKEQADTGRLMADREDIERLVKLVDQLGETCKKILVLFYYENLPMKKILEDLNYENEQVVRNKKYKCLKKLEEMISANPELKNTLKTLLHG